MRRQFFYCWCPDLDERGLAPAGPRSNSVVCLDTAFCRVVYRDFSLN